LLDRLTPDGRVVTVSSRAHFRAYPEGVRLDDLSASRGYDASGAYGQSKLCNLLLARELARRLPAGQTAYSLHPGVIPTNLSRHMNPALAALMRWMGPIALKTIPQGAATQCFLATQPGAVSGSGEYWADCNVAEPSERGRDAALALSLYERSLEIAASLP
jgi:WW domain-containing oxidoreductase